MAALDDCVCAICGNVVSLLGPDVTCCEARCGTYWCSAECKNIEKEGDRHVGWCGRISAYNKLHHPLRHLGCYPYAASRGVLETPPRSESNALSFAIAHSKHISERAVAVKMNVHPAFPGYFKSASVLRERISQAMYKRANDKSITSAVGGARFFTPVEDVLIILSRLEVGDGSWADVQAVGWDYYESRGEGVSLATARLPGFSEKMRSVADLTSRFELIVKKYNDETLFTACVHLKPYKNEIDFLINRADARLKAVTRGTADKSSARHAARSVGAAPSAPATLPDLGSYDEAAVNFFHERAKRAWPHGFAVAAPSAGSGGGARYPA